jgi:hypothetical protein
MVFISSLVGDSNYIVSSITSAKPNLKIARGRLAQTKMDHRITYGPECKVCLAGRELECRDTNFRLYINVQSRPAVFATFKTGSRKMLALTMSNVTPA